jgi:IS30 family transposase
VKLTKEDAELIRQLSEWKKREIERLNSIASVPALAEKFGVHHRSIERVLAHEIHR